MSEPKLKNCGCGGKAILQTYKNIMTIVCDTAWVGWVACDECGIETPEYFGRTENDAKILAATKWNNAMSGAKENVV